MDFMTCTTCRAVVQINNTGVCLACQKGFKQAPEQDHDAFTEQDQLAKLKKREKELEDAIQVETTREMDVGNSSGNGQKMGKRNAQKRKASKAREAQEKEIKEVR